MPQQELQRISRWICGEKERKQNDYRCSSCMCENADRRIWKRFRSSMGQAFWGFRLSEAGGEPNVEGLMYGAGTSLIEIFPNAEEGLPQGAIRHFALATDDVDSIVETVRKARRRCSPTMEPGAGYLKLRRKRIPSGADTQAGHLSRREKKSNCSVKTENARSACILLYRRCSRLPYGRF